VNFALWWLLAYVISSRFCSHFVGYLEEEAVFTYTKCLWVSGAFWISETPYYT